MLSLATIFKYLQANPDSRNICEGEQILNSGHIILCGKQETKLQNVNTIFGLCLQSSSINNYPHEVKGEIIMQHGNLEVKCMHCTCKAGNSGRCKHAAAILIYCTRCNLNALENVSTTDMKCIWNQKKDATLSNYKPIPLLNTHCLKNVDNQNQNISNDKTRYYNKILEAACPHSTIVKHKQGRINSQASCSQTLETTVLETSQISEHYDHIHITNILDNCVQSIIMMELESNNIKLNHCCQSTYNKNYVSANIVEIENNSKQNSVRWQKERQFRITGSRAYNIFTYSKGEWDIKAMKYFWPKKFSNVYVKHGIACESIARKKYEILFGLHVVETGFIVCNSNPWLGYSPDGIILNEDKPYKLLEIKCPYKGKDNSLDFAALPYLIKNNDELMLKKKHMYYGQIQFGMAVLNLHHCDFFIYSAKDEKYLNITVQYDENFCRDMLFNIKSKFFNNMIHYLCLNTFT